MTEQPTKQCRRPRERHGHTSGRAAGGKPTPEYTAWCSMIQRCERPAALGYANYGGRGIKVCDPWRSSFEAFLQDVGARPSPKHSLDRIDVNGDYEPGNVRWATREEQFRNLRKNRVLTLNGETLIVSDWAKRFGMKRGTLCSRLARGMSLEAALACPVTGDGRFKARNHG